MIQPAEAAALSGILCPRCKSPDVRKSRLRLSDIPGLFHGLRAARCHECCYRFRFSLALSRKAAQALAPNPPANSGGTTHHEAA
jgi:hypothetical protein